MTYLQTFFDELMELPVARWYHLQKALRGIELRIWDLSDNLLYEDIPFSISKLKQLELLNLKNNQLTGPIPSTLTQIPNLKTLDLARNQLIGEIPRLIYWNETSASLKFTVLNPEGRIWTMVAGGGASVIYADTVGDLGYASELGNYAEYSGAPNEEEIGFSVNCACIMLVKCLYYRYVSLVNVDLELVQVFSWSFYLFLDVLSLVGLLGSCYGWFGLLFGCCGVAFGCCFGIPEEVPVGPAKKLITGNKKQLQPTSTHSLRRPARVVSPSIQDSDSIAYCCPPTSTGGEASCVH
ncbi:hypothetical protein TEA_018198 [Camellia sinensis var. sinensis]|uniref:ATP-citrate synthase citrate-binding domain-containing protein n=1 Tax=Camellia sinensis var. sinensis TaxID=542762 RepID=A0A4S4D220_CAMSN|nr:hypothetical protein TEA_018198 [Camellia sinensis var. sinensis]